MIHTSQSRQFGKSFAAATGILNDIPIVCGRCRRYVDRRSVAYSDEASEFEIVVFCHGERDTCRVGMGFFHNAGIFTATAFQGENER